MKSLKFLLFILITSSAYGQLQNNNWIFGYGARVNFSGANPVSGMSSISSNEATASVSDPLTGQLLFYTDSRNVWNANHQVMPNGSGLLGGFFTSATQGALIVPFPNNNQKYYLFTLDEIEVQPNNPVVDDGLRYSVVDMSLNGGLGDVEVAGMNTQLATDLTEKLIVIRSTQIQGFWVIAHKRSINQFLAWKIDACGISAQPVVSTVGSLFSSIPSIGANEGWAGAMDASPSGDRIGMPIDYSNKIEFFDFDKTMGIVSNPLAVTVTDNATPPFLRKYGACFSPDGSKFYYSNTNSIYQLDLTNYNVPAITSSFTLIASPMFATVPYPCFQIEQGPNNKLYVAIGNSPWLDEISNPNALGLACGYVSNAVNLSPGVCQLGLPAQVPLGGFAACNSNTCSFSLNATVVQPTCGNNNGCISFAPSPTDTYFYLWPFPTIMIVDSVCGLASGSYQISITNSSGCTVDTTIVLTNVPCGNNCSANGDLIIYSNYDGGILTINVDQNIPNLKVGICTYEPIQVAFTGPFVGNVTQVIYAGMNSNQNNNNCGLGNFTTSITGVPPGIVTISPPMNPPQVGYTPAHGNGSGPWGGGMLGVAGLCDTLTNAGGGNTPDEVVYYFLNATGGTLLFHQTQYACWTNQTLNVSSGGNCCILPAGSNPCSAVNVTTNNVIPVTCTGQANGSFTIASSGGASPYDYVITGAGGVNFGTFNNVSGNQTVSNLPAGTYTISITDNNNCTGSGSVVIPTQSTAPSAPIVTTTAATCSSAGTAAISNYNATFSYTFSPGGPTVGTGGIIIGMNTGTSYTVTAVSGSCTSNPSISFSVAPQQNPPNISATANGPFCVGGAINISASGGVSYSWSGPNGFSSNAQNPQIFPANINQSGTYSVTVSDANGCVNTASVSIQVTSTPTVSVSTTSYTFNTSESVTLSASGANNFVWSPGGATGSSLTINSPTEGLLTYCAIGSNTQGCQDSTCINLWVVKFDCGELYIPNAFSPNGDYANDEFCVYGAKCIETMQLKIFDRWGNMVFETSNPDFCWDGSYNGKMLNTGVFAYTLAATFKNGEKKDVKGNVSLIK
ncbi:MAG: gliding motility-associated C-terminal domain-containing protein [Bacteroidota bacterium]